MRNLKNICPVSVVKADSLEEARQKLGLRNKRDPLPFRDGKEKKWTRRHNIIGMRFGKLVAVEFDETFFKLRTVCKCDCGNYIVLPSGDVKKRKCCGCDGRKRISKAKAKHRMYGTPEYSAWGSMKTRCYNQAQRAYKDYGARGISVCDRWRFSFENFLEDMGLKPSPKHSIDRINNNGNYEPGNCRWVTIEVQADNKRTTRFIEIGGVRKTVAQWSRETGIGNTTLYYRLSKGVDESELLAPPDKSGKKLIKKTSK